MAWRQWFYDQNTSQLESVVSPDQWPGRKAFMASCGFCHPAEPCDKSPGYWCGCGVHGYKEPDQAEEWLTERNTIRDVYENLVKSDDPESYLDRIVKVPVIGEVSLWGRIMRHVDGFRAEKAYPYSLRLPEWAKSLRTELQTVYGVETAVWD